MKTEVKKLIDLKPGENFKHERKHYQFIVPHFKTIARKRDLIDVWRISTRSIEKLPVMTEVKFFIHNKQ